MMSLYVGMSLCNVTVEKHVEDQCHGLRCVEDQCHGLRCDVIMEIYVTKSV